MIRPYREEDDDDLSRMLEAEGIEPHRMQHRNFPSYCLEERGGEVTGFVTIREEHGFPSVQHLCVKRGKRNHARARQLSRYIVQVTKDTPFIMHAAKDKPRIKRLIEAYWDATLYGETEDKHWFLVRGIR